MKNVGTPWLLALCAAAAIGCGGSSPTEQVVTGRVTTRGAVAVRAVSGTKIVTAARVRADGSFTLALPAGSTYRLDLLTTGGVKHVLERSGTSFTDLTFDVCQPGSPWNLGTVDDGAGSGSGSGSGGGVPPVPCEVLPDGTTDCPPPPPPCDPTTGQNCPPPCGSNGLECPCEVNPDGTTTCPPPPPPPPCDPTTDANCPCQTGPDGTTTCPPPPPPPPCDPSTDPTCPCAVNADGTTNCPQPPPCPLNPDGTPNCPQPCDASTDPTCPTPPPPCTDPSDPNTCQDPCMTDPSQCGCAVPVAGTSGSGTSTGGASGGTASCWPPPQPPQCDSAGNCDPTGVAPQFPPGNFGCHGAGL